jgi:CubicO group peptidase (beta-lactamase class C family)
MRELLAALAPTLEAKVGAFRREHRAPGVLAGIADRDGLQWWHGSGFADIASGRAADDRTLYRIASITKTFTATAVLQLRDDGRLRLDDPVVRHVPEVGRITAPHGPIEDVTVRRLLQHSSGLQGEVPWGDLERFGEYRPEELAGLIERGRIAIPADTDDKYSNFGFEILGLLVERVSGRPFTEYVRAEILAPLGLDDTTWDPTDDQAARRATGYDGRQHEDIPPVAREFAPGTFQADGGLWSTAADLGAWIGQQLRADESFERGPGQVLRGRTLIEMHRPALASDDGLTAAQGLCWYALREGETVLTQHSGGFWGFLSNISFQREAGLGSVVLVNGMAPPATLARQLIDAVLPAVRETADRAEVKPFVPVPEAYRELLGAYRDVEAGDDTVIEWRDGTLLLLDDRPGRRHHELDPTDDPLVFAMRRGRPAGEPLTFIRGASGRIERCNVAGYPAVRLGLLAVPPER